MRMFGVLALAWAVCGASAAAADDRGALQREIAAAANARDWCRALHYTERLEALGHDARLVWNAAELARAAGDLLAARAHYVSLLDRDADYAKAPLARQAIEEVTALIDERGAGTRCQAPPPRCGDGAAEGTEACDDGNMVGGDVCAADCSRAPRCGDAILDADEMCDDGNLLPGDDCSPQCLPEAAGSPRATADEQPGMPDAPDFVFHDGTATPPRSPTESPPITDIEVKTPAASRLFAVGAIGAGVVGATAGLVCTLVGPFPLAQHLWQAAALGDAEDGARQANTAQRYAAAVAGAGTHDRDARTAAEQWNSTGRVVTAIGISLLAVGVGGIVGGGLLYGGTTDQSAPPPVEVEP